MLKNEKNDVITSLNENFKLEVQQLEQRLETDPLFVGGGIDLSTNIELRMEECFSLSCGSDFEIHL